MRVIGLRKKIPSTAPLSALDRMTRREKIRNRPTSAPSCDEKNFSARWRSWIIRRRLLHHRAFIHQANEWENKLAISMKIKSNCRYANERETSRWLAHFGVSNFTTEPGQTSVGRGNQTPRNTEMRSADFIFLFKFEFSIKGTPTNKIFNLI